MALLPTVVLVLVCILLFQAKHLQPLDERGDILRHFGPLHFGFLLIVSCGGTPPPAMYRVVLQLSGPKINVLTYTRAMPVA